LVPEGGATYTSLFGSRLKSGATRGLSREDLYCDRFHGECKYARKRTIPTAKAAESANFPASCKEKEHPAFSWVSQLPFHPARPMSDFKGVSFAPSGLVRGAWVGFPRLAPWAAFLRRSAACQIPQLVRRALGASHRRSHSARPAFDPEGRFFRPSGACAGVWVGFPRLAPWAAFLRRSAAGQIPLLVRRALGN